MKDKFGILCRFMILAAVAVAVIVQVMYVMLDCHLVSYTDNNEEQGFGLFKLQESARSSRGRSSNNNDRNSNNNNQRYNNYNGRMLYGGSADCVGYDWLGSDGGGFIRVAQWSVLLAVIGGGLCFLLVFLETTCQRVPGSSILDVLCITMAVLFSGLVFLVIKSDACEETDDGCVIGSNGAANIAAMVLYAFAGLIMCCTPKPRPVFRQLCCPGTLQYNDDDDKHKEGTNATATDDLMTVGVPSRRRSRQRRIRRTPSAIVREMDEETVSLGGIMSLETKQDRSVFSQHNGPPPPVDMIEVQDGNASLADGLTVDPRLQDSMRRIDRTPSEFMRELEDENMTITDFMSVNTSPGMSCRKSPSDAVMGQNDGPPGSVTHNGGNLRQEPRLRHAPEMQEAAAMPPPTVITPREAMHKRPSMSAVMEAEDETASTSTSATSPQNSVSGTVAPLLPEMSEQHAMGTDGNSASSPTNSVLSKDRWSDSHEYLDQSVSSGVAARPGGGSYTNERVNPTLPLAMEHERSSSMSPYVTESSKYEGSKSPYVSPTGSLKNEESAPYVALNAQPQRFDDAGTVDSDIALVDGVANNSSPLVVEPGHAAAIADSDDADGPPIYVVQLMSMGASGSAERRESRHDWT
ncbi:hypothetical protein MPSEU_000746300 [Mayamaea pseudoterrestris]|nr:hypothetical protein MPSEU_000746300 [Mayamaea pseudoterrestris]